MAKKVVLVKFLRSSFNQLYSYKTDIDNLTEGDILVVQTNNSYSLAEFVKYSSDKAFVKVATKYVVEKVNIEEFEEKLFLGDLD